MEPQHTMPVIVGPVTNTSKHGNSLTVTNTAAGRLALLRRAAAAARLSRPDWRDHRGKYRPFPISYRSDPNYREVARENNLTPRLYLAGNDTGHITTATRFRLVGWADVVNRSIHGNGWVSHPDDHTEVIRGVVYRLPHNRFIAGSWESCTNAIAIELSSTDDPQQAALWADDIARYLAEETVAWIMNGQEFAEAMSQQ